MISEAERYQNLTTYRSRFWRRYIAATVIPVITIMLTVNHAALLWLFFVVLAASLAYTRLMLYRLGAMAGFPEGTLRYWIAASFLITGWVTALWVLEAPLRRVRQRLLDRALDQCGECGSPVWEDQTDCVGCGMPVAAVPPIRRYDA